jgi:hypothetical protein
MCILFTAICQYIVINPRLYVNKETILLGGFDIQEKLQNNKWKLVKRNMD